MSVCEVAMPRNLRNGSVLSMANIVLVPANLMRNDDATRCHTTSTFIRPCQLLDLLTSCDHVTVSKQIDGDDQAGSSSVSLTDGRIGSLLFVVV